MSIFNGKTLLITGGTGSFGNAVLRRFLNTDIKEIRIFSRDEKKQDDIHFPCRSLEAGAFVRVLPHGSRQDQHHRDRQCADGRDRGRRGRGDLPVDRQGRISDQRHEHIEGLHPLWQCDVLARFGHPFVDRADAQRQPHHHY